MYIATVHNTNTTTTNDDDDGLRPAPLKSSTGNLVTPTEHPPQDE